ncbi:MAG: hypothetical protein H6726_19080 [Sandaracinaceae bacterium]|nr:hypothetical protein [Sandaracinaceae bacterium]
MPEPVDAASPPAGRELETTFTLPHPDDEVEPLRALGVYFAFALGIAGTPTGKAVAVSAQLGWERRLSALDQQVALGWNVEVYNAVDPFDPFDGEFDLYNGLRLMATGAYAMQKLHVRIGLGLSVNVQRCSNCSSNSSFRQSTDAGPGVALSLAAALHRSSLRPTIQFSTELTGVGRGSRLPMLTLGLSF